MGRATEWGPFAALAFLPLLVHVTFGQLPWVGPPAVTKISRGVPYSRVVRCIVRDFAIFVTAFIAILLAVCFAR
jgi:di/tricarboxylate transporter